MAIEYSLITQNGDSGSYWAGLPTTDPGGGGNYRERYGDATNGYRVFNGFNAWYSYYNANKEATKSLVVEVQGAWDDTSSYHAAINGFYSITFTAVINGSLDPDSFHGGVVGGGFRRVINAQYYAAIATGSGQNRLWVVGLEVINSNTSGGEAIRQSTGSLHGVLGCIVSGYYGVRQDSSASIVANSLAINCRGVGFYGESTSCFGTVWHNNLAVKGGEGFHCYQSQYSGAPLTLINNISLGNTTNWWTDPTWGSPDSRDTFLGLNNAGESGDPVYDSGTTAVTVTTSDFYNWVNDDYRPASSSSALVGAGDPFVDLDAIDINWDVRPNYNPSGEEAWDIGPFEYDHGNGLAPATVDINISGMAEGSVLAIYKDSDSSEIVSPTTIGASGEHSLTYSYTGDTAITVVVRKGTSGTKYLPYSAPGLITSAGFALIVSQVEDTIAA